MSVVKVIEMISDSKLGWEDAAKQAVEKAAKSLHNVKSVYIKDQSAKVENGKIVNYRVNVKVSFVLD
jgi:flavin-binding protein dodecin